MKETNIQLGGNNVEPKLTLPQEIRIMRNHGALTFAETREILSTVRGSLVEMLDLALEHNDITKKERDIMYYRHIEWKSLQDCGELFGVTRERIRQIESKVEEKMRQLTKKV